MKNCRPVLLVDDSTVDFKLNVAGYAVKPVDYRKFVEAVRTIDLYWTLSESSDTEAENKHADCTTSIAGGG